MASTSSSGGAISSDDNRFRRGLGNGNARLFPFGDGDASRCAKTSVVSSSKEEPRLWIVRSVSTSSGGGVLDSSPPPGGDGIMAPSDAVRAAWALFLGLNQRVPRATATDARSAAKKYKCGLYWSWPNRCESVVARLGDELQQCAESSAVAARRSRVQKWLRREFGIKNQLASVLQR